MTGYHSITMNHYYITLFIVVMTLYPWYYYFTKEIQPYFGDKVSWQRFLAVQLPTTNTIFRNDEWGIMESMRAYHIRNFSSRIISPFNETYFQTMALLPGVHTVNIKMAAGMLYGKVLPARFFIMRSNDCRMLMNGLQNFDAGRIECTESRNYSFRSLRTVPGSKGRLRINFKLGLFEPWLSKDGEVLSLDDIDDDADVMTKDDVTAWYVHVINGGVVNHKGEVYTADRKIQIASLGWIKPPLRQPPKKSLRVYDEVFVLSQHFRGAIFHWMIEEFPRLFRMLPFLVKHPGICIHAPRNSQLVRVMLEGVGINASRILDGNVQARTIYLPTSTYQGRGSIINTNLMSTYLRAELGNSMQDSIVLIKRSRLKRWFNHHDDILKMLKRVADEFGLRVLVFGDAPVPRLDVIKRLFHDAVAVVGPHGAGLANLIYSQPGTCVVEALCYLPRLRRYELCFRHLAHILGHLYHGVVKDLKCCMDTRPEDIEPFVRQCLKYRKQQKL